MVMLLTACTVACRNVVVLNRVVIAVSKRDLR